MACCEMEMWSMYALPLQTSKILEKTKNNNIWLATWKYLDLGESGFYKYPGGDTAMLFIYI